MKRFSRVLMLATTVAVQSSSLAAHAYSGPTDFIPSSLWWNAQGPQEGCQIIKHPVTFCGDRQRWPLVIVGDGEINALYAPTTDTWVEVAVKGKLTDEQRRRLAIDEFAADAMRLSLSSRGTDFVLAEPTVTAIDGRKATMLIGSGTSKRSPMTAANTVYVGDEGFAVAVVSLAEEAYFTDRHRRLHREFLSGLRIDPSTE